MGVNKGIRVSKAVPHQDYYVLLFILVIFALCIALLTEFCSFGGNGASNEDNWPKNDKFNALLSDDEVILTKNHPVSSEGDSECHFYNCFEVYRCGRLNQYKLSIYVYPIVRYEDEFGVSAVGPMSREFRDVLETIVRSPYYTEDPNKACILVPSIDLLNQNRLDSKIVGQALATLPQFVHEFVSQQKPVDSFVFVSSWDDGKNHLLFNMIPGIAPKYGTILEVPRGKAIVAGGGFSVWSYRKGYDVSIPVFNPLTANERKISKRKNGSRKWFVVSSQTTIHSEFKSEFRAMTDEHPELLVLDRCDGERSSNFSFRCDGNKTYHYPDILQESTFCLVVRGARLGQTALYDVMMSGCIPVVVADSYVLPFSEVLDWKRASVLIYEDDVSDMMHVLKGFSDERISEMRQQVVFFYEQYFSSINAITTTTLDILNDRVFSHVAKSYEDWNDPPSTRGPKSPLFLPIIAPKSQGFTAVILTYDRLDSLFQVIQNVVKAPSLAKVLVVWNNQNKPPPQASMWPKISKPLKVVQTLENKLSNRFYPYDEIETEAILAIDDDIVMLTADELEFGFEVWREFPDRIVGFPSRVHLWDNVTNQWKYQSEWTNEVSMVLTGVAFYHKFWSYMYTTSMPKEIRTWVDEHMNCEDIAMNFLVTNMTGKAPIKVAPRKKFKCPECTNTEMLSTDLSHMIERSKCVNKFAEVYGCMPLKPVEFRADPVLYKDNFPEKLKRYNNIGSL